MFKLLPQPNIPQVIVVDLKCPHCAQIGEYQVISPDVGVVPCLHCAVDIRVSLKMEVSIILDE